MSENSSQLQPLGRKEASTPVRVSLRGSLAQKLLQLRMDDDDRLVGEYIESLLTSSDSNLVRLHDGQFLIMGLRSEMGSFFPDW